MSKTIKLKELSDIYQLVGEASKLEGDVLIKRGKFVVDAKSILGILSIDMSQGATITYPDDAPAFDEFISKFEA